MRPIHRPVLLLSALIVGTFSLFFVSRAHAAAVPPAPSYWRVEDIRRGMKGYGRTVMKGTKVETFQAEILGVLRNTSPGRDLVLARLSGLDLERTGVIAGMSGSPVYIDGKLVGAVAYAWPFGKEPIAGITPFTQMQGFVEALERHARADHGAPRKVGLGERLNLGDQSYDAVTVSQGYEVPTGATGLWMVPLRTPLAATGFSAHSLKLLAERTGKYGLVPVMGGAAGKRILNEEKAVSLEPGGPLSVALITGDFDLSGIGTTTHVEGNRVWGWGHPFMSLGGCQLPMFTGYIHTIYPRQTVSFKMGSPLREVGMVHADVSTCIAGTTDRKASMLPLRTTVSLNGGEPRVFNVRIARHRTLLSSLVYSALTNAVDMEGEMPEEVTAYMRAKIEVEGRPPIILNDTFSGFSGGRAPAVLYTLVASTVGQLVFNSFSDLKIKSIECETRLEAGRISAEIDGGELDADIYRPGDTVTATVFMRPHKGARQKVNVKMKLPEDLPEGSYSLTVCDEPSSARMDIRGDPTLYYPTSANQLIDGFKKMYAAQRTTLVLRLPMGTHGVATAGKTMPQLPSSMVHILTHSKRTGSMTMLDAVTAKTKTPWVIQGAESLRFKVSKSAR